MNKKHTGLVFDIQRFSLHDGPGIRTTVFLKGCNLNCLWCHNPEGKSNKRQLKYLDEKCILCKKCENACKFNVHYLSENKHFVNFNSCVLCESCVRTCPSKALEIVGIEYSAEEIMDIVSKDEAFFGDDGGVSFSGGEPLNQDNFLLDLLKSAKKRNYTTCVDTCGYNLWESYEKIIPFTDYILYDIKGINQAKHIEATSKDNNLILDNLKKLNKYNKKIFIRIPLIVNYSSSESEVQLMADFIKDIKVEAVTLMPYHTLGRSKYEMLGYEAAPVFDKPSKIEMEKYTKIFQDKGIKIIK